MAKSFSILGAVVLLAVLAAGCAGPEKKFGRGINNVYEPIRLAEMRRSIEQGALAKPNDINYHTGVIRGFNKHSPGRASASTRSSPRRSRPMIRFSPITCAESQYPDSLQARLFEDSTFRHGYFHRVQRRRSVAPFIPGSRFRVFDN
jgi:hypothetical protein